MILEIAWTFIAFGGLIRALMLWQEAILDRRSLGDIVNGKRLLARWQIEHAVMGIFIYLFVFVAGFSALLYRLEVIPLKVRLLVASLALVAMLLTLVTRQERDAHYRKLTLAAPLSSELETIAADTNMRVREIQKRGQDDNGGDE